MTFSSARDSRRSAVSRVRAASDETASRNRSLSVTEFGSPYRPELASLPSGVSIPDQIRDERLGLFRSSDERADVLEVIRSESASSEEAFLRRPMVASPNVLVNRRRRRMSP